LPPYDPLAGDSLWWLGDGIRCAKLGAVIVAGRETLEHFQKQFSS